MKSASSAIKSYLLLALALLAAMAAGRIYEMTSIAYFHGTEGLGLAYIIGTIVRDLQWALIGGLIIWPMHILFQRLLPDKKILLTALLITLTGMANILLINYFTATLTPLGPEFWAYSWQEMSNTTLASGRVTLLSMLILAGTALSIFFLVRFILSSDFELPTTLRIMWTLPLACLLMLIPPSWVLPASGTAITNYQSNKLAYFISSSIKSATPTGSNTDFSGIEQEYPFLHKASRQSKLAPFFRDFSEPPNIVFLIVESLGGEFIGDSGQWTGFAPNLDSLARSGLYWKNGLSLSGRTFGMMPSIFGSLPPGPNGFMDLGPDYPAHQTLISLLDERGYQTSFFSGFNTYFDKLDFFLEYQGIDFVLDKQNIEENYTDGTGSEGVNYWGFDDKTMLGIASSILDTLRSSPRLEIYHTLQSHSPFTVPNSQEYEKKFDWLVNRMEVSDSRKEAFLQYRAELTTLLFADEAVGQFMEDYRKKPYYENTIFVITGDHWLIPVPQTSQISRYHVPIIIHSPLLREPVHFKSVNTHANLTPALIALLEQKTALSFPDSVHWIGSDIDTTSTFQNVHSIPLMKNKNQLTDYLHNEYYLSENRFYQLGDGLSLIPAEVESDEIKNGIKEKLSRFTLKNRYVVTKNKLYPGGSAKKVSERYAFLTTYDTLFTRLDSLQLNVDQQFQEARLLAFDGHYNRARAVAQRILLQHPEYHDVELLVGRTYAWQGDYKQAREVFNSVLEKAPSYHDTYTALYDVAYWDGNIERALEIINKGLQQHPLHEQFLDKKVRALAALDRNNEARQVYNTLLKHHPENSSLDELKTLLTN